jgi:hypothetical protein
MPEYRTRESTPVHRSKKVITLEQAMKAQRGSRVIALLFP